MTSIGLGPRNYYGIERFPVTKLNKFVLRFICVRLPIDNDEYAAHKNYLYTMWKVCICPFYCYAI